jgi:hypothetical protein
MLEGVTVPSVVSSIHLYSPRVDIVTLTSIAQEGKLESSRARISHYLAISLGVISPTLLLPTILRNYGIIMQYYVNSSKMNSNNILNKLGIEKVVA